MPHSPPLQYQGHVILAVPLGRYHDIMWFDISVYDVVLVGERQCCGDLLRKYYDFRICHRPLLTYIITQRLSFDQLHHYVVDIAFSAYIIYIYDIGMRQACCSLRLPPETVYKFMVVYELQVSESLLLRNGSAACPLLCKQRTCRPLRSFRTARICPQVP